MTTPFDDLPSEVRRANYGWFGEPWPGYACYAADGRLIDEMRKPFPAGESCLLCGELFDEAAGDSGKAVPEITTAGTQIHHAHKECLYRSVAGGLAHQAARCSCHGGPGDPPTLTRLEEARAVWRLAQQSAARAADSADSYGWYCRHCGATGEDPDPAGRDAEAVQHLKTTDCGSHGQIVGRAVYRRELHVWTFPRSAVARWN